MSRQFFEPRPRAYTKPTAFTADAMRHLHSRQYLGKVVILCASPLSSMRVARKQWLKLARMVQKERSSTLNADKILRFTYAITHMHHMQFTSKPPLYRPEADVYFTLPDNLDQVPLNCYTLYIAHAPGPNHMRAILRQLPENTLVVDYTGAFTAEGFSLGTKDDLETACAQQWKCAHNFLKAQGIVISQLIQPDTAHLDAMDEALDTLLGVSHSFLAVAGAFQRAFELAQPMAIPRPTRQLYNTLTLLAYRVQALTPSAMGTHMLRTYHEDEAYFFHELFEADDYLRIHTRVGAIHGHRGAGRYHLANALARARSQQATALPRILPSNFAATSRPQNCQIIY